MQVASTGTAVTVVQSYTYDAMGRPLTTTHKIGNGVQRTISSKAYDELGRLSADNRNGLASLKETRSYNLRSWLTNIDGQMFTEVLKYENSTIPQWGGNISVMQWGESAVQNAYSFIYDTHSRLMTANYSNSSSVGLYSEIYNYDLNGNMLRHVRGSQPLVMNYSGNRLTSAGNAAFEYDAKGRLVLSAYGSGLSTEYNILDLPQRQTTGDGTVVDYKYAFDGRKLQEKVTAGASVTQRDYSGEFLYEGGVLKKILFDGGYVINDVSGPVYMFFLRDHLGSVRAVVSETGAVQQMNHYFPYGDMFPNTSNDSSGNRYKYTGKESGDEIGLYDFSARFLHTRFGRFTTIDPLAEKYPDISPYAYCNCNPVNFVDPDGKKWVNSAGKVIYDSNGVSLNASNEEIELINTMMSTRTGRMQLRKIADAPFNIVVIIDDMQDPAKKYGEALVNGIIRNKSKDTYIPYMGSKIIIYKRKAATRSSLLTTLEAMAVNFAHEIEHLTNENLKLQFFRMGEKEIEMSPDRISHDMIREFYVMKPLDNVDELYNLMNKLLQSQTNVKINFQN